ncbi:MAG: TonB-dependent receptor [Gammaproteobacteria bacterium]
MVRGLWDAIRDAFCRAFVAAAAVAALALCPCGPAFADDAATHALDIPVQDLGAALSAFAAAANEQVLFSRDVVAGLCSTAVKGEYTTDAALAILLHGSGLEAARTTSGVLLIRAGSSRAPPAGPEAATAQARVPDRVASASPVDEHKSVQPDAEVARRAETGEVSEVSVTGTRIRGLAPVGSALISIDRTAMAESGLGQTNDVLNTLPSVLSLGNGNNIAAGTQIQNGFSGTYGNSPNIHGVGPGATLSLVNGHRTFNEGIVGNAFDPNNLPIQMLSRVEVVQDGTSPIYGADAVAGTINYVLRRPVDTFEIAGGTSWSRGNGNWYGTLVVGRTWNDQGAGEGGVIASFQQNELGAMRASTYPRLYNDNFAPYGAAPSLSFASPGNVVLGGTTYAIPAGQDGRQLTLSQLGASGSVNRQNGWTGMQAIPEQGATRFALNFEQNLTDTLQVFGDGIYSHRTFSRLADASSNNLAVSVPNSNPYSPCNPSHYANGVVIGPSILLDACAAGGLQVNYSSVSLVGPRVNDGLSTLWEATTGVHIDLARDWKLTLQATSASHLQNTGTTTPNAPDLGSFNFFCDDGAFSCNPPGSVHQVPWVGGTSNYGTIQDHFRYYQLNADGPVLRLPAGDVRLATGIEYDDLSSEKHTGTQFHVYRQTRSAYAELYIPILRSLGLDLAGRTDSYSDTGTATNPKIGISWSPISDLRIRGSFGRSFHPAPMLDLASLNPIWMSVPVAASAISPALCPRCTDPELYGPGGANKLVYNEAMGAHTNLVPETSRSFSFGADWNPATGRGFTASVNYWWIDYINQVGNPQNNAGPAGQINQQYYNEHIVYNPTFFPTLALNNPLAYFEPGPHANLADPSCAAVVGQRVNTQALFDQFVRCAGNSSAGAASSGGQALNGPVAGSSNDVLAFGYYGQQNAGSTRADGLDLSAGYAWDTGSGTWKLNGVGEHVRKFDVSVIGGAPVMDEANRFGHPLRFKGRGQLNWAHGYAFGDLSASLFINYSSAYRMDLSLLAPGVPASYASIASSTTADLTVICNTGSASGSWLGEGTTLAFSAQNIFNSSPPLVINPAGGGGPGILFDPANGFPLSRTIQLRIDKVW